MSERWRRVIVAGAVVALALTGSTTPFAHVHAGPHAHDRTDDGPHLHGPAGVHHARHEGADARSAQHARHEGSTVGPRTRVTILGPAVAAPGDGHRHPAVAVSTVAEEIPRLRLPGARLPMAASSIAAPRQRRTPCRPLLVPRPHAPPVRALGTRAPPPFPV